MTAGDELDKGKEGYRLIRKIFMPQHADKIESAARNNGFHYVMTHVTVKKGRQRTCLFVVEASRAALGILRLTLLSSNVRPIGGW